MATAVGGEWPGKLFEGDRRFDIVVRLPEDMRRIPTRWPTCRSRCRGRRDETSRGANWASGAPPSCLA
ncbi:MAG: hypothetical protein LKM32_11785 [Chiayiivirga sp.]|uniref:hypothetical protein n=1 Tax=Chiayiivirga sp. TaxID=2041042 RepID=UPI0025B9D07C|nr:hypothetical protein [Chiayiivirga sp.]MCI1730028.1 hypothetical protein [Chiayiivirga sp.]